MEKAGAAALVFRDQVVIDAAQVVPPVTDSYRDFVHGYYRFVSRPFYRPVGTPPEKGTLATTNRCCSRKVGNHDKTWQKGFFLIEAADATYKRTFIEYGTDYPTSLTPSGARPAPPANVPTSQPAY